MKVQQLFYTSCKKGISLGMGFQTYSMSEGITEEERKEIEAHCIYIPPENLPTQPTKEEIEKLFPVALSSFRLKNGKYCICQSKYIGKDYSGRYGNYFSHVLISDEMWPFYPIELYGSITFRDCLTFEEENVVEINPLPNLEEIHLGNVIDFYTISKFLKGTGTENRRKSFKALMDNVVGYEKKGKALVFWDSKENNPYWIGAIQMSLPKNLAQTFSFTTYCYNPENTNYIISALDKDGSVFRLKGNQKLYKYTFINFNESNQQIINTNFSKLVEVGYTVSKEVLLSFLSFVEQFEYNLLDEDIEDCICLYNIVNKGIEKLNVENIKKAITFANTYKSQDAFTKLFEQISPNLEKISTQVDRELTEIVAKFLFNMGRETKKYEHIQKAYVFFFDAMHCLITDEEDMDEEEIFKLYKKIRDNEKESSHEFIKMCLDKNRIEVLNTYLEGAKGRHAKFYLKSIIEDIIAFNKECDITEKIQLFSMNNEEDINRTKLLKKCMEILLDYPKDIEEVVYYFKDEWEYVSNIVIMEYIINLHKCKSSSVEEILAKFVVTEGEKDIYWKKKVYSNMYAQPYGMDFMFYIFKYELSKNMNNENFFIEYCEEIFDEFIEYRNKRFWQGVDTYINFFEDISLEGYKKILNYVCKNSSYLETNKRLLQKIILNFEEKIRVEDADGLCNGIEEVEKLKNKYKINTHCSITELVCIYKKLQDDSYKNKMKALRNFKADFSHMSREKYEEYLSWILSNLSMYIRDYIDHSKIERAFLCEEYEEIYYRIYTDTIINILYEKKYKNMLKDSNIEAYEIFLDYVIFTLKGKVDFEENIQQYVEDKIIYVLQNSNERKINNYDKYIVEKIQDDRNEAAILKEWEKIKIKSAEKGGFKNILSFFKR
ncbi:hypothetical protein [uncultured Clostridium sp.]|uniref:GAP1-N2 domain-containing protein n=1 Tax=uncultured Clostridium sp. TaxID=59620 RepID=UPI0028E56D4D|nr:hypothetical protein [uncultured Clostridium sp.]